MSDQERPEGWAEIALGDLVRPSKEKAEPDAIGMRPYVGLEHIAGWANEITGHSNGSSVKSTVVVFHPGDVLFSKLRPYLNKVAVAPFEGVGSSEILVFSKQEAIESKYLMWLLSKQENVKLANDRAAGVQLPRITFSKIADISLPLPPLAEQRRIVEKVEELLAHVNAARDSLAKIPPILKRFRQSILSSACSGRLTGDGTGRDDWASVSLAEIIEDGPQNGLYKPQDAYGDGTRIVRIDDFHDGRLLRGWAEVRRLSLTDGERRKYGLQDGDLLVNRVNSPKFLGKPLLVSGMTEPAVFESNMMRFRVRPELVTPQFLLIFLLSPQGSAELRKNAKHAVNQSSINQADVCAVELSLPPLPEQHEIVRRVEALFAVADAIEKRVAQASARADRLTQSILAKAFRGELVPTEASLSRAASRPYESAEELLARIQLKRPVVTSPRRHRRAAMPRSS